MSKAKLPYHGSCSLIMDLEVLSLGIFEAGISLWRVCGAQTNVLSSRREASPAWRASESGKMCGMI